MALKVLALALGLLLVAEPAAAQTRGWFPRQAGECGWVHGRYAVSNGSGTRRIWVIGTNHLLNLWDSDEDAPSELDIANDGTWAHFGGRAFNRSLYGDFLVCAAERFRPGHMQHIRIRRVRNLVVGPYKL